MIRPAAIAHGVATGPVTVVFGRWARQNVRPGDTPTTPAGVVAIGAVTTVDPAAITDADAARAGAASADDERLARLDRCAGHGPWTHEMLRLIATRPGRRAVDLATMLGATGTSPRSTSAR